MDDFIHLGIKLSSFIFTFRHLQLSFLVHHRQRTQVKTMPGDIWTKHKIYCFLYLIKNFTLKMPWSTSPIDH